MVAPVVESGSHTQEEPGHWQNTRLLGPDARLAYYSTFLFILGAALWLGPLAHVHKPAFLAPFQVSIPPILLLGLCYGTSLLFVEVRFQRSSTLISFVDIPVAMGLLLADPHMLLACYVVGVLAAHWTRRGIRVGKDFANIANDLNYVAVAYLVYSWIGPDPTSPFNPQSLGALCAAMIACGCLAGPSILIAGLAIIDWEFSLLPMLRGLGAEMLASFTNLCLAVIGLLFLFYQPYLIFVLIPPLVLVLIGKVAASDSQRRAIRMEFLYKISSLLHSPGDVSSLAGEMLGLVAGMFNVERAEMIVLPEFAGTSIHFTSDQNHITAMEPRELTLTELEVLSALSAEHPVAQPSANNTIPLTMLFRERSAASGMVVLLRGRNQTLGMLLLLNPRNYKRKLADQEESLLVTVASQVSVALENGQLTGAVQEMERENDQLTQQALHDSLTGLANRTLFLDRVEHAVDRFGRSGSPLAILFVDLDGFKEVNDTFGHANGDRVLCAVANRLRQQMRAPDTAARLGGDEFAILLEDLRDAVDARLIAGRIVAAAREPVILEDGQATQVRASVGVVVVKDAEHLAPAADLLRHADGAMYQAKRRGKDRYEVFDPTIMSVALDQVSAAVSALEEADQSSRVVMLPHPGTRKQG